jgi:DNA primase
VRKLDRLKQEKIIEEVKQNNEIVAVISEYVNLKEKGRSFLGLCPFHGEKTPSFTVSREKQLFHCFGCSAGGDVINFIMRIENLNFPQALRLLAERVNITLPNEQLSPTLLKKKEEREYLYKLNALATSFYQKILFQTETGKQALAYLEARGISRQAAEKFRLGYSPPHWTRLVEVLRKKGLSLNEAEKAGLVRGGTEGFYDRFRDRLMFPISNSRGQIIGFGGRILGEEQPKYLNSPETVIFQKGRCLYGLFQAREGIRKARKAIIVEGYLDVIQAHQHGVEQVVASLGTALTSDQVRTLKRYTKEVIIAYDADAAGQSATIRGLDLLDEAGVEVRVAMLPEGEDPDSLVRKEGTEKFLHLVEQSVDLFTFKLKYILGKEDLSTPIGKARAVDLVFALLSRVKNKIAREAYIRQTAAAVGISEESFYDQWRIYEYNLRKNKERLDIKRSSRHTNDNTHAQQLISTPEKKKVLLLERELLRGCLQEKENFGRIKKTLMGIECSSQLSASLLQQLIEWDVSGEWPPPASVFSPEIRTLYIELLTENEMNPLPVDVEGCCRRLRQYHLTREIQRLQKEVAASSEEKEGNTSSMQNLHEKLALLNELHKKLREEFPTFSGSL